MDEWRSSVRRQRLERVKAFLERHRSPRTLMFWVLCATGIVGFLASALLRLVGLTSMAARYPLAIALAYLVFLGLLRLWLRTQARRDVGTGEPWPLDAVDSVGNAAMSIPPPGTRLDVSPSSRSGGIDLPLGDSEVEVVLLIAIAVLVALCASVWLVLEAPTLLAEVVLDGAAVTAMTRRLRSVPSSGWAAAAIRRSWLPFFVTALTFTIAGALLHAIVPDATTMGEALRGR